MKAARGYLSSALLLGILAGATALAIVLILPPAPLSPDAPASVFSAGRAMQDLYAIAQVPHPMGSSQAHADVRNYLLSRTREVGLGPEVQKTFGVRLLQPGWLLAGAVENIVVRVPGRDPQGAILLMSHYDTTPGSPGGVDSSSGVATVLELMRAVAAGPPLRQDAIFFLTDGEEPGTIGAHAFVDQHPWFADVRLAINLDSFQLGPPMLVRTTTGNGVWVEALAKSSMRPAYQSLPFELFASGDTDLLPFAATGVAGADIVMINSVTEAHTMADRPDLVDPGSLQQAGDQVLALVRTLGQGSLTETDVPDQTFFPLLGRLVHYPASWAVPLASVAMFSFVMAIFYGRRRNLVQWRGVGTDTVVTLGGMALSVGVASAVWQVIEALHPEYGYSTYRPHMSDDYLYTAGLIALAGAAFTLLISLGRRKISGLELAAGTLVFWAVVTTAATIIVPASSYLATWVLLANSLALLLALGVKSRAHGETISGLGFLTSAIVANLLWVPVLIISYLASTAFLMLALMIGLSTCWLVGMAPSLDWIASASRWVLPAAGFVVGLALMGVGHLVVGENSPPPMVNSIGYWLDAESQEGLWLAFIGGERIDARSNARYEVAFPQEMDERQVRLMVDPVRRDYADLFEEAPPFSVLTSAAPRLSLAGPRLEVIADTWEMNRRLVRVRLMTSMHDRVYVVIPDGQSMLAVTLPGNERTELPKARASWSFRLDGMPLEGINILLEVETRAAVRVLLLEEKTGLPIFPEISTATVPGTMPSPGEYEQGIPADFTASYRAFTVQEFAP